MKKKLKKKNKSLIKFIFIIGYKCIYIEFKIHKLTIYMNYQFLNFEINY